MQKQTMGAFIAALRKAKGITQKELAEMLNVSDKAVSRWECDQTVPDLMLVPVIADIFEVTADELLRGGKMKNEQATESQERNIQKRLETLLMTKYNSYKSLSVISIAATIVGILIAFICRECFARYELGIGISLVMFTCAVVCQIILFLNIKNSIGTVELNSDIIKSFKTKIFEFSFWIFASLLSLEVLILSVDPGLFFWCGPVAAIGIFLLCVLTKHIYIKRTGFGFSEKEKQASKLFIKVFVSFVSIVAVLATSMVLINVNCRNWLEKPKIFYITDSTEEIESYIDEGIKQFCYEDFDDQTVSVDISEDDITFSDDVKNSCFIIEYKVKQTEKDGKTCKEVKLWTEQTRIKANSIKDSINLVYIILYCLCIAAATIVYIKKLRRISSVTQQKKVTEENNL